MEGPIYKVNRILANMIDALIMFILTVAICIAPSIVFIKDMMNGHFVSNDLVWLILSFVASILVWIIYLTLTCLLFKNATLGMRIMKLAFVNSSGGDISFARLFFRELTCIICFIFSLGFTAIFDPISLICSTNCRNFYDVFSSTKVVNYSDL